MEVHAAIDFLPELFNTVPGACLKHTDPDRFREDVGMLDEVGSPRPVDILRVQLLKRLGDTAYELPLPPGWTEHVDFRGFVYFGHALREETSWDHPLRTVFKDTAVFARGLINVGLGVMEAASAIKTHLAAIQALVAEQLEDWSGPYLDDSTGEDFYYNSNTGASVWENPMEALQYELHARYVLLIEFLEALHSEQESGLNEEEDFEPPPLNSPSLPSVNTWSPTSSPYSRRSSQTRRRIASSSGPQASKDAPPEVTVTPASSWALGGNSLGVTRVKSSASAVSYADSLTLLTSTLSPAVQPHALDIASSLAASATPRRKSSEKQIIRGVIKPPKSFVAAVAGGVTGSQPLPPPLQQPPMSREGQRQEGRRSSDEGSGAKRAIRTAFRAPELPDANGGDTRQPTAARRLELSILDITPPETPAPQDNAGKCIPTSLPGSIDDHPGPTRVEAVKPMLPKPALPNLLDSPISFSPRSEIVKLPESPAEVSTAPTTAEESKPTTGNTSSRIAAPGDGNEKPLLDFPEKASKKEPPKSNSRHKLVGEAAYKVAASSQGGQTVAAPKEKFTLTSLPSSMCVLS